MAHTSDILVIGGGPAGLTAALYAARAGKRVTLLEAESCGGQIVFAPKVENYPGLPDVSGADFAAALCAQAERFGAVIEYGTALSVERTADGFAVQSDLGGLFRARALILAPGAAHRTLGLAGEDELVGCGVSYCAVCDGAFYAGTDVAVLGGGNTALGDALFLSGLCRSVTLIHRRKTFRGEAAALRRLEEKPNVKILTECAVAELLQQGGALSGVRVRDLASGTEQDLTVSGLFVAIGQVPRTGAFRTLVALDPAGYIAADESCRTNVPGVFAAGDCRTKGVRQLTTATGDGAAAALAACAYLDT